VLVTKQSQVAHSLIGGFDIIYIDVADLSASGWTPYNHDRHIRADQPFNHLFANLAGLDQNPVEKTLP
jgi:hypothetical protein